MPELPRGGVRSGPDSAGVDDACSQLPGGNLRGKLRETYRRQLRDICSVSCRCGRVVGD